VEKSSCRLLYLCNPQESTRRLFLFCYSACSSSTVPQPTRRPSHSWLKSTWSKFKTEKCCHRIYCEMAINPGKWPGVLQWTWWCSRVDCHDRQTEREREREREKKRKRLHTTKRCSQWLKQHNKPVNVVFSLRQFCSQLDLGISQCVELNIASHTFSWPFSNVQLPTSLQVRYLTFKPIQARQ